MYNAVIGYPRIGVLRELKFAIEKYFRGEISTNDLEKIAKEIRSKQWEIQKSFGLDFISSNDFSYYDNVLDTAVLFNIIPKRYSSLGLSVLDTYFAMARGYQGKKGDVTALAMKKWFNTNYHYIVPEIDDDVELKLVGKKPFDEYKEAKRQGIQTKPVIIGAFTLLKLLKYSGNKEIEDYINVAIKAYSELLTEFNRLGVNWIQFDEPCLVYDLTKEDINLFEKLYNGILTSKAEIKVLLQTYFGDIRDCYSNVIALDFDGIGLDFVEGKETLKLIREKGFPNNKTLFAGLVNGKNIWKNNYEKTLKILDELKEKGISTVISSSCSLLHVPYTLKNETKLSEKYIKYFSFAEEKLEELVNLKKLSKIDYFKENVFLENCALFKERPDCNNQIVKNRVKKINENDFTRFPDYFTEAKLKRNFNFLYFQQLLLDLFLKRKMLN